MNNSEFYKKTAAVTGAAQGIGKAIVTMLQQAGARVAQLDIQFEDNVHTDQYHVDVSDSHSVRQVIDKIENHLGPIEYLVNAAGILYMGSLLDSAEDDWHKTFAVNTTGAYNVFRVVAHKMRQRQQGVIVAVGSNAATVPRMSMGSYAASKAAMTQMIKCLGLELAEANVRCNIVAPGSTDTEMQRQLWTDDSGPAQVIQGSLDSFRLGIPLKRIATAEQVASVVLFLLSKDASHITLETIVVDGGATLGC
ncbi:MAG: 2,3-dihydro-2,3-dihydroxybenzoate dehydrogenase [Gammaproteobacteria bacterium]